MPRHDDDDEDDEIASKKQQDDDDDDARKPISYSPQKKKTFTMRHHGRVP